MESAKKWFQQTFSKTSKVKLIVILGLAGMILILVSCLWPKAQTNQTKTEKTTETTEQYVNQLEEKVGALVSQIDGVGKSQIMITLENGVENVYANSEKKSVDARKNSSSQTTKRSDNEQSVVVVDGADGKEALVVTQKEPTVKGVVVVCEGANNLDVVQRVKSAVTTSLNVKNNRVSVVKAAAQNQN